jgi:hypothetical protein
MSFCCLLAVSIFGFTTRDVALSPFHQYHIPTAMHDPMQYFQIQWTQITFDYVPVEIGPAQHEKSNAVNFYRFVAAEPLSLHLSKTFRTPDVDILLLSQDIV